MTTTPNAKRATAAISKAVSAVNPVTDSLLQQILEELQYMNAGRRAQAEYRQRQFQMMTEQPKTFAEHVEESND